MLPISMKMNIVTSWDAFQLYFLFLSPIQCPTLAVEVFLARKMIFLSLSLCMAPSKWGVWKTQGVQQQTSECCPAKGGQAIASWPCLSRLCPFSPSPMLYSVHQICFIYGYGDFGSCRALFCTHHTGNWGTEIMKTWQKNRARQRTSPLFFLHLPPSPPNVVILKEEGESKPRGC